MLPDETEVTFKSRLLTDQVKDTDTGLIELPVVTAATGKVLLSAA